MIFGSDATRGRAYRRDLPGFARPGFVATSHIPGALPGRPIMPKVVRIRYCMTMWGGA
jgi:hypothetical protein